MGGIRPPNGSNDRIGNKTNVQYWNGLYERAPRYRLPLPVTVGILNAQRLLRRYVKPGAKVLEIGFAPGKLLAWVARRLDADVTGLDFSPSGIVSAKRLFEALAIKADMRCEDVFDHSLNRGSFDVVYSIGVIEHFDNPTRIIREHVELVKPGGVAVIVIPNYQSVYGALQRWCDPANLAIHNLDIMSGPALLSYVPTDVPIDAKVFRFGRLSPALVNWERRIPTWLSRALMLVLNGIGLLQPVTLQRLAPWLVLAIRREPQTGE